MISKDFKNSKKLGRIILERISIFYKIFQDFKGLLGVLSDFLISYWLSRDNKGFWEISRNSEQVPWISRNLERFKGILRDFEIFFN